MGKRKERMVEEKKGVIKISKPIDKTKIDPSDDTEEEKEKDLRRIR